jgi:hypothetical protein
MSVAPSWPARVVLSLLVFVLGSVSARTWAAEDSSFTRESRKPKASRRALLAATTRSIVAPNAGEDADEATPREEAPPPSPISRSTHVSVRRDCELLRRTTTPEYLLPHRPSGPAGLLSPPA